MARTLGTCRLRCRYHVRRRPPPLHRQHPSGGFGTYALKRSLGRPSATRARRVLGDPIAHRSVREGNRRPFSPVFVLYLEPFSESKVPELLGSCRFPGRPGSRSASSVIEALQRLASRNKEEPEARQHGYEQLNT